MLKGQKSENITETHQNKAQKAKITAQNFSERVGTVLKGPKKRKCDFISPKLGPKS